MRTSLLQLAYSNVWISLSAAGFAFATQACLGLPRQPEAPGLAFATMFMVYTFAKAIHFDPQADALNDPQRTAFLLRWRAILIPAACFGYLLALSVAWREGVLAFTVLPFVTALAYDLKWLPRSWRYRRLKDIPGVKSLVVALTWGAVTVLLPARIVATPWDGGTAAMFVWSTLLWFVNTVFFDVGDMAGDELEGTRTLPLVLGFRRTRRLLLGLCGLAALTLWQAARLDWVSSAAAVANLTALYSWAYVFATRRPDEELGFRCDVTADGMGIFCGLTVAGAAWLG